MFQGRRGREVKAVGTEVVEAAPPERELDQDSGSIIYTEFRGPIIRASDSTEDIKLVCEF